ncbi:hypothetical protein QR685DRAFT_35969 [Neurospora intermedia]|uniref:Secreted protein n=1 Tax=Neurospora intermedia TaxID=5142 RepID=A0ABR3DR68_NEUIN
MQRRYCRLPAKRTAQRTQGGSLLPGSLGVRCLLCFVCLGFRLNLKKRGLHFWSHTTDRKLTSGRMEIRERLLQTEQSAKVHASPSTYLCTQKRTPSIVAMRFKDAR